jgi:hypothetical protein
LFPCCLFWFCSSSLLQRSLSDLQYFSNSAYRSCMDAGFSLAKWAAKSLCGGPWLLLQ